MSRELQPGDFLVFQLEAGFALIRLLAADDDAWHVAAYSDLFPDVETAEAAAATPASLVMSHAHIALTDRAFKSTQVARIANILLTEAEKQPLNAWRDNPGREISDRSVRLMLGLR